MKVHSLQDSLFNLFSGSCGHQLCSMVRDMSTEVRIEVFDALGKTETVSLTNLLQSLSKKVLGSMKENRSLSQSTGPNELSSSSVAGALVHGFEDEFYEVIPGLLLYANDVFSM